MSGRRYSNPRPAPKSRRAPLRTTQGRIEKMAAWLALQRPGAVPPVLVALDRAYREARVVVCPVEASRPPALAELVPTAAAIACEFDRLGAIVFGFDAAINGVVGLLCVDVVQGSQPMAAHVRYEVEDDRIVPGRPAYEGASRLAVTATIATALGIAFGQAGRPDQGPPLREWMAEHGYGVDQLTL